VYYSLSIGQKCLRCKMWTIVFLSSRSDLEVTYMRYMYNLFLCNVFYRVSIAQKLLKSDFWTTGDRNIALLLAGYCQVAGFVDKRKPNQLEQLKKEEFAGAQQW